jgi:hypothetical protein
VVFVCTSGIAHAAPREVFEAFAVDLGAVPEAPLRGARSGVIEITIDRWSTQAEQQSLANAVLEKGPEDILRLLQKMPSTGRIRTPGRLGYTLRYAHEERFEGGRRIFILTDRPIDVREAIGRPRSIDYPFTFVEMRLDAKGEGEGKMSIAARIVADPDTRTIELENYSTQPVDLRSVKKRR